MARKTRTPRQGSRSGTPRSGKARSADVTPGTPEETPSEETSATPATETPGAEPPKASDAEVPPAPEADASAAADSRAGAEKPADQDSSTAESAADAQPETAPSATRTEPTSSVETEMARDTGGAADDQAGSAQDAPDPASVSDATEPAPKPDAGEGAPEAMPEVTTGDETSDRTGTAPEAGDTASAESRSDGAASGAGTPDASADTPDAAEDAPPKTPEAETSGPEASAADAAKPDSAEERGTAAAAAAVPAAAGMAAAGMATAGAASTAATSSGNGRSGAGDTPAAPPPSRSALPLFLGGVVAAGLGLGVGWYAAEEGWIGAAPEVDLSTQDARIDSLSGEIEALEARLAEVAEQADAPRATPDDLAQVESGVQDSLDSGFAELSARIDTETEGLAEARAEAQEIGQAMGSLLQRLERAEAELTDLDGIDTVIADQGASLNESISALSVRVASIQGTQDELRAEIAEVRDIAEQRIEDIQTAAAEAAAEADRRAALAEARAALDTIAAALQSGAPFAPALARVETATDAIGQPLRDAADSGVPTVGTLQDDFGRAARAGLSASLQRMESESTTDRLTNFLRSQVGQRSLQPREGDDPDAVMSRATQAVNDGDIAAALDELEALPAAGQEAMSGWLDAARARMDALNAYDALAADMTAE